LKKPEIVLLFLLMASLAPLEILCAYLAYETIGEIISNLYFLAIGFNLIFIIVARRSRTLAALGTVVLALVIIPYQLQLGYRLLRLQAEATQTVAYLYEYKAQTGTYPPDLSRYTFADPALQPYFHEYQAGGQGSNFLLSYYVGSPSTSHTFSPENGWSYYPD